MLEYYGDCYESQGSIIKETLDSQVNILSDRNSKINKPRHLDMRPVTGEKAISVETKDIKL